MSNVNNLLLLKFANLQRKGEGGRKNSYLTLWNRFSKGGFQRIIILYVCTHARIEREVLIEYKSWLYKGKTVALWQR